jgi:hypothetical protein
MAVVRRVRRLVNPRRRRRNASSKRRRTHTRRRLSAAQIAAGFGGKRRKSAAKSSHRRRTRRAKARTNPAHRRRVKVVYRTKTKYKTRTRTIVKRVRTRKHRRRKSNPVQVLFGPALNPRRRRRSNPVAKRRRRKTNAHRVHHRRRRRSMRANPVRVVYRTRRRSRRHMNPRRRRRNPVSFSSVKDTSIAVVAGLAGVTITKMVPGLLGGLTGGSPIMTAGVSALTAWGAGYLATKMLGPSIGHAVAFGGYMQAGSVALNAFLPSVGSVIGLSGLRGLVPSNDILLPYNMFAGRGAMVAAGSPGSTRSPGGGSGFAPAFA